MHIVTMTSAIRSRKIILLRSQQYIQATEMAVLLSPYCVLKDLVKKETAKGTTKGKSQTA